MCKSSISRKFESFNYENNQSNYIWKEKIELIRCDFFKNIMGLISSEIVIMRFFIDKKMWPFKLYSSFIKKISKLITQNLFIFLFVIPLKASSKDSLRMTISGN